jgi:hypothetical protein
MRCFLLQAAVATRAVLCNVRDQDQVGTEITPNRLHTRYQRKIYRRCPRRNLGHPPTKNCEQKLEKADMSASIELKYSSICVTIIAFITLFRCY